MHDWPIDRELDERLRRIVLDEVAAADPRQIAFRHRPDRRRPLVGTAMAAAAVFVLVAALAWRNQSAPEVGGPSATPSATAARVSPSGVPNPSPTLTQGPTLQAGLTPGPAADPACRPGRTYDCWADGPAVPLSDGRVLYVQTGALYDPATHTFTATGRPNVNRFGGTATLLGDGRVLIAGGQDFGVNRDATMDEIYDPRTGRSTPIGPVAPHNPAVAVALPDGRVLIVGGSYTSPAQLAADLFDPAGGTFTAVGSTPRAGYTSGGNGIDAVLLGNGKVLVVEAPEGGQTWSTEIYDPATNTFTPSATSAVQRAAPPALAKLPDGRAMLFGGGKAVVEAYDPATNSFDRLASMPGPNVLTSTATLTDGRILAIGVVGVNLSRTGPTQTHGALFEWRAPASARPAPPNSTEPLTLDAQIYDPAQNGWTDLGHLNLERITVQVAPLPNGGAIVTGTTPGGMGAEVAELFDPKTGRFALNQ